MTWIKICGITREEDAFAAANLGVDALGFNFFRGSPRYIDPKKAAGIIKNLPESLELFGVFVNEVDAVVEDIQKRCGLHRVQFHGDESLNYCVKFRSSFIRALRVEKASDLSALPDFLELQGKDRRFLLDSHRDGQYGGTGMTFDWKLALLAKKNGQLILSGGLKPENVRKALVKVAPFGVDVASGVEENPKRSPGKKDLEKMKAFVHAVQAWDHDKNKKGRVRER